MIEKFAGVCGQIESEFLDLNHTTNLMILVSLLIPKFSPDPASNATELRNRDTRGSAMATDYGEKERAFIDGLKEATGRDLGEWLAAISAEELPHRNDIIDWLRQQGFMFSKASWLERIHHNGGRLIYGDSHGSPKPTRARRRREPPPPSPSPAPAPSPAARVSEAAVAPPAAAAQSSEALDALLAKAKAYRPLALALIAQIRTVRPAARFEPRDGFVAIADPKTFVHLGIGAKELRLHLALGEHPFDGIVKKGVPGGGLGKADALSHMVILTDARQIDRRLLELVAHAATHVNG